MALAQPTTKLGTCQASVISAPLLIKLHATKVISPQGHQPTGPEWGTAATPQAPPMPPPQVPPQAPLMAPPQGQGARKTGYAVPSVHH